ncbi:response regulator transcription factor [Streptomyces sp. NPDC003015]
MERAEQVVHPPVDAADLGVGEHSARHTGLFGDEPVADAVQPQQTDRLTGSGDGPDAVGLRSGVDGRSCNPASSCSASRLRPSMLKVEVAGLLAEGLSTQDIAARLHLSRRTVETHLSSVYRKLSVPSRSALTRLITRVGLGVGS